MFRVAKIGLGVRGGNHTMNVILKWIRVRDYWEYPESGHESDAGASFVQPLTNDIAGSLPFSAGATKVVGLGYLRSCTSIGKCHGLYWAMAKDQVSPKLAPFIKACEDLFRDIFPNGDLNPTEREVMQYYLSELQKPLHGLVMMSAIDVLRP